MLSSISKALALAIAMATVSQISPAIAQDTPPVIKISVAGLDLTSPEGRRALDSRIKMAAERLCGPYIEGTLFRPTKCINDAKESAQPQRDWLIAKRQALLAKRAALSLHPHKDGAGAGNRRRNGALIIATA